MREKLLLIVLVLGAARAVAAADGLIASPEPGWPQWRGPRRDGISEEKGLLGSWPEGGPKLLWKVDGLGKGWSSPVVAGGRLYVTGDVHDDLVVFAFDTGGAMQWRSENGKAWKRSFPGARAPCALSEGRLYHLNAHGRLACLEAASGKELWAFNILERFDGKNITWALSEWRSLSVRLCCSSTPRKARETLSASSESARFDNARLVFAWPIDLAMSRIPRLTKC